MPYESEKQRRFMYSQKPEIAKRWDEEGKNYIRGERRENKKNNKYSKYNKKYK